MQLKGIAAVALHHPAADQAREARGAREIGEAAALVVEAGAARHRLEAAQSRQPERAVVELRGELVGEAAQPVGELERIEARLLG